MYTDPASAALLTYHRMHQLASAFRACQAVCHSFQRLRVRLQEPLIGATGKSFVQQLLANSKPAEALKDIQQRGGMANPHCKPLLGMLDYLHVSRWDSVGSVGLMWYRWKLFASGADYFFTLCSVLQLCNKSMYAVSRHDCRCALQA